jgi:hypothetical protein
MPPPRRTLEVALDSATETFGRLVGRGDADYREAFDAFM